MEYAADDFKADLEVVLAAVTTNGMAFKYSSDSIKRDRMSVLAAISKDP